MSSRPRRGLTSDGSDERQGREAALAPARAGRKEWVGLAVIALPCLLYSMDLTVLHLAVPELSGSASE